MKAASLTRRGALCAVDGRVLLAGDRCDLYDQPLLTLGWKRVDVRARAQGNQPRTESLWLNRAAVAAVTQPLLELV